MTLFNAHRMHLVY